MIKQTTLHRIFNPNMFKRVFENVVVVVFLSVFSSKMHQDNIFFIFKKLFLTSAHLKNPKT